MEFCPNCKRYMPRIATANAKVIFECEICHVRKEGQPEDTLWFEEARIKEDERFQMYLSRASHDLAGKTVQILCDKCGRQYMTLVRIGKAANALYVCECGHRQTVNNYIK